MSQIKSSGTHHQSRMSKADKSSLNGLDGGVASIARAVGAVSILLLTHSVHANSLTESLCNAEPQQLVAEYQMIKNRSGHDKQSQTLSIWRNDQQVAQQFTDAGVTEIWHKQSNGRVRPIRYFDKHQRGIEYMADEVGSNDSQQLWQTKYQLITDATRNGMTRVESKGSGCKQQVRYEHQQGELTETLIWLPQQQLVMHYEQRYGENSYQVNLKTITADTKMIEGFYSQREQYQTTDYADVGDNESDPFLMNMVNLGFIKEGHSGFYSASGEKLAGHGHH